MRLSTKGRYGLRMMLDLALNYGRGYILMKDIARRQEISERYLGQLVRLLKTSGLVKSLRGAHGGYALTKSPTQIRLSEIIRVLEGSVAPLECIDDLTLCDRASRCAARDIWKKIKEAMENILESTTLQDLVEQQTGKQQFQETMYYI